MIQDEVDQLIEEIDDIGRKTQFNGRALFAGAFAQIQVPEMTAGVAAAPPVPFPVGFPDMGNPDHWITPPQPTGEMLTRVVSMDELAVLQRQQWLDPVDGPVQFVTDDMIEKTHGLIHVRTGTRKDDLLIMEIARLTTATLAIRDENGVILWNLANLHSDPRYGRLNDDPMSFGTGIYNEDPAPAVNGIFVDGTPGAIPEASEEHVGGRRASRAIDLLDASIAHISFMRSQAGAYENRLEHTSSVIGGTSINLQSALSRMVDTDMALEMSRFTQLNVISQAGISVLSLSNQRPQQMLQLLNF
jgi:flagellin-like hook-associated protein FlgL